MNQELIQNEKSREEQIIRWATFIRKNPNGWKKQHSDFIDSQIRNSNKFYEKIKNAKNAKIKICELRINRWNMKKEDADKYREFCNKNKLI